MSDKEVSDAKPVVSKEAAPVTEVSTEASRMTKEQVALVSEWQSVQLPPNKHCLENPKDKLEKFRALVRESKISKAKEEIEADRKVYEFVRERNPTRLLVK